MVDLLRTEGVGLTCEAHWIRGVCDSDVRSAWKERCPTSQFYTKVFPLFLTNIPTEAASSSMPGQVRKVPAMLPGCQILALVSRVVTKRKILWPELQNKSHVVQYHNSSFLNYKNTRCLLIISYNNICCTLHLGVDLAWLYENESVCMLESLCVCERV